MMQVYGLPEVVARLLIAREIPHERVNEFLSPTLKDHFPNPFSLAGMENLAKDLAQAITEQKPCAIFGDFDVDGATSSALLHRFFKNCGLHMPIYIPDRLNEGYGPNIPALAQIKADGAKCVIMADCGITAHEVVSAGREMGLEIIILDHHEPEGGLPEANHVINPKRPDCHSGLTMLAACGVSFLVCVAVNVTLKKLNYYEKNKQQPPDIKGLLDLVAFGTVCDMVPLCGANRLFVRAGMHVLNQRKNPGIQALCETAQINAPLTPMHLGFALGPRINAGSRVHRSDLGAKLLSTDSDKEAVDLAWALHDCNERRKSMQKDMLKMAENQVMAHKLDQYPIIVVDLPEGHSGLSGLVAGRLKDKYRKPACVVTYTQTDEGLEGRGSGRSIEGISMADLFIAARQKGVLLKGGGHAMAGGFSLSPEKMNEFRDFINDYILNLNTSLPSVPDLMIDGLVTVQGATPKNVKMIHEQVGPFGQGHDDPRFALADVRIHNARIVGNGHVSCQISDIEGGKRMKAIAFGAGDEPLGQTLLQHQKSPLHLAGTLKVDNWNGTERAELHIQDAALL